MFSTLDSKRQVKFSDATESDEYPADPFGEMRQVSFKEGIVDMDKVLGKG